MTINNNYYDVCLLIDFLITLLQVFRPIVKRLGVEFDCDIVRRLVNLTHSDNHHHHNNNGFPTQP